MIFNDILYVWSGCFNKTKISSAPRVAQCFFDPNSSWYVILPSKLVTYVEQEADTYFTTNVRQRDMFQLLLNPPCSHMPTWEREHMHNSFIKILGCNREICLYIYFMCSIGY